MRVARFRQSTSTPVANGSRVPQCPTLLSAQQSLDFLDDTEGSALLGLIQNQDPAHTRGRRGGGKAGFPALRLRRTVKHQLFPPGCFEVGQRFTGEAGTDRLDGSRDFESRRMAMSPPPRL